jgi:hypothetical protein
MLMGGGALDAGDDLGALLDGIGDVRLDLLDRLHVDQWPDHRTRLEPIGDLHRIGRLGEALGERVVDAALHQNPGGAHALTSVAVFRGDGALNAVSMSLSLRASNGALLPNFVVTHGAHTSTKMKRLRGAW